MGDCVCQCGPFLLAVREPEHCGSAMRMGDNSNLAVASALIELTDCEDHEGHVLKMPLAHRFQLPLLNDNAGHSPAHLRWPVGLVKPDFLPTMRIIRSRSSCDLRTNQRNRWFTFRRRTHCKAVFGVGPVPRAGCGHLD
jgi:hypothetical protein